MDDASRQSARRLAFSHVPSGAVGSHPLPSFARAVLRNQSFARESLLMPKVGPVEAKTQGEPFDFKGIMAASIERYLDNNPAASKKSIAMDLGATSADLSHWLSDRTTFTLPGHLIAPFCQIVGDNSLIWHVQSTYEKAGSRVPA